MLAGSVAGAGLVACVAALLALAHGPVPTTGQLVLAVSLCLLVWATWVWPLVIYREGESEAVNLAEGAFVLLALLLPWDLAIAVFAVAAGLAEVVRRHSPVKFAFNWGQIVAAVALGLGAARLIAAPGARLHAVDLLSALVGAAVFIAVNISAMAALATTLSAPWRSAVDGSGLRLRLAGGCAVLGIVGALAISAYGWAIPLALLPFVVLRQVLAGHFQARHDRTRLLGLFSAALEANASIGEGDPMGAILASARSLLRCSGASVSAAAPGPAELGASMLVNGQPRWLVVSGRSHNEPFDAADRSLLDALAAVGAGALTNAELYREVQFERERLAAITSSVADGVCALDPSGTVTFANPAAAAMLGEQVPARLPEDVAPSVGKVVRTGETLRDDDAELRRPDGSLLPVALTASPILDGGQVAGAVVVFRDITQRREAEQAIRVARDQAIESSRLKSQFLANVSHEIRTPMNGVLGLSRMLLTTSMSDKQRRYLLALQDCGENLMAIINDVLDFSKIEAGKLELEEVDFELRASLTSVTNTLAVAAHDKGLALCLDYDPALPRTLHGDPIRLRQILINLVGNAIKFTEAGVVVITVEAQRPGWVRIAVRDTGIGIDPALRAKVLSPFGQADSSTTRRFGGTGLGLAICSHLVGMMAGVLDFTSRPGEGSVFWVDLPLRQAQPVVQLERMAGPRLAPGDAGDRPALPPACPTLPAGPRSLPDACVADGGQDYLPEFDLLVRQVER